MKAYDAWTSLVAGSLGLFSPVRAMAFRHAREHYRSYSAASKTGPNQRWRPKNESADALIRKDQALIISRCRDLARNNPYISGAIRKICNTVVRQGIKPQARNRTGDRLHKLAEWFAKNGIHPFRRRALKRAEEWMHVDALGKRGSGVEGF